MNRTDFTKLGGLKFTQNRLGFLQAGIMDAFAAIAKFCGDKTILYGCEHVGSNVTEGWISYQCELIRFPGCSYAEQVVISEVAQAFTYANASVQDAQYVKTAVCGVVGTFPFSDLKQLSTLAAVQQSLADLIAAFNLHTHSWAAITDKPAGYITYVSRYVVGNVGPGGYPDARVTIGIPDQGSNDYIVSGTLRSVGANWDLDNDQIATVGSLTSNSFKLLLRFLGPATANLVFDYAIIKTL